MNRRAATVVVALALLGLAPAAGAAEVPQAARTSAITAAIVYADRSPAPWVYHTPRSAPIAATHLSTGSDALRLTTESAGAAIGRFEVRAASGAPLLTVGRHAVGTTEATVRLSLTTSSECTASAGEVDVLAVEHDGAGRITSLAAEYDVRCTEGAGLAGWVRWNSDVPYVFTTTNGRIDPAPLPFGQTVRASVDVTNAGTAPTTYGPSTFPRVLAVDSPHSIERDGCDGVTVAPGGTCRIDLAFTSEPGRSTFFAYLRTPDGSRSPGAAWTDVQVGPFEYAPPSITATSVRGGVRLTTTSDAPAFEVVRDDWTYFRDVTFPWTDTSAVLGTTHRYVARAKQLGTEVTSGRSNEVTGGAMPLPRGPEGEFVTLSPTRVLDTRTGTGGRTGAVGPRGTLTFDPLAGTDVPGSGVLAVVLNVTGTGASTPTHVRVWPSGTSLPGTSSLNLVPGRSRPNQVVVPLGADGNVALYNDSGSTHLVVDVQGYYTSTTGAEGAGYHPVTPTRALDTRSARGSGQAAPLDPDEVVWVPVTLPEGAGAISAVDVNLTVTEPRTEGHLIAWSGAGAAPGVSNANFVAGQTIANHSAVPVSYRAGRPGIAVRNAARGTTHLVVDVQGWYDDGTRADGLRYAPVTTARIHDSRTWGDLLPVVFPTMDVTTVTAAVAHVVNVTATQARGPGHVIAWSGQGARPATSAVNYVVGEDAPNLAVVSSPRLRLMTVTTMSSPAHVVVDQIGFFY